MCGVLGADVSVELVIRAVRALLLQAQVDTSRAEPGVAPRPPRLEA